MAAMLAPFSRLPGRPILAAMTLAVLLGGIAGCSGDTASVDTAGNEANVVGGSESQPSDETEAEESGAPSNKTVESYFEALASRDPDKLSDAMDLVVPESYAEATLTYYISVIEAVIAAGYSPEDVAGTMDEIDGGYRLCTDPTDEDTCGDFTNVVGTDGLVSGFQIDGEDRTDKLVLGSGESSHAGTLGEVTLRAASEVTTPDRLNVVVDVTSGGEPISVNFYTATYRTPQGRQVKASSDSSLVGSTDLQPDSSTTSVLSFPNAAIGGEVTLEVVSDDYSVTKQVKIPTK